VVVDSERVAAAVPMRPDGCIGRSGHAGCVEMSAGPPPWCAV